mmetsp:Transcript_37084/g.86230  ORF Transcript_37084/g.86230 Transcript_37084/m.86230 type:complete len:238 (-) Transcript_37084:35-748(-)
MAELNRFVETNTESWQTLMEAISSDDAAWEVVEEIEVKLEAKDVPDILHLMVTKMDVMERHAQLQETLHPELSGSFGRLRGVVAELTYSVGSTLLRPPGGAPRDQGQAMAALPSQQAIYASFSRPEDLQQAGVDVPQGQVHHQQQQQQQFDWNAGGVQQMTAMSPLQPTQNYQQQHQQWQQQQQQQEYQPYSEANAYSGVYNPPSFPSANPQTLAAGTVNQQMFAHIDDGQLENFVM